VHWIVNSLSLFLRSTARDNNTWQKTDEQVSTPTTCQFWQIHYFTWFRTLSADVCNWRLQQQLHVNFDKSFVLLGLYHAAPDRKPQWGVNLLLLWDQ
jgi:hypothetical protein